jgi:hypothetical protein
MIFLFLNW